MQVLARFFTEYARFQQRVAGAQSVMTVPWTYALRTLVDNE